MPDVKTKQIPLPEQARQAKQQADTLTQQELKTYAELYNELTAAEDRVRELKRKFDPIEALVIEVSTGKSCDDLATLKPEEVARLVKERVEKSEINIETGTYDFALEPTQPNGRQSVEWKQEVIRLMGPAYATRLQKDAPVKYSYAARPVVREAAKAA